MTVGGIAPGAAIGDPVVWWGKAPALESIAHYLVGDAIVRGSGATRWVRIAEVSGQFFSAFGLPPSIGRDFQPTDGAARQPVALLSYALWETNFKGTSTPVGATIRVNGVTYDVVGVAPGTSTFRRQLKCGSSGFGLDHSPKRRRWNGRCTPTCPEPESSGVGRSATRRRVNSTASASVDRNLSPRRIASSHPRPASHTVV